jgi:hypothetical protein
MKKNMLHINGTDWKVRRLIWHEICLPAMKSSATTKRIMKLLGFTTFNKQNRVSAKAFILCGTVEISGSA